MVATQLTRGQKSALAIFPFVQNPPSLKYQDEVLENMGKVIDKAIEDERAELIRVLKMVAAIGINSEIKISVHRLNSIVYQAEKSLSLTK